MSTAVAFVGNPCEPAPSDAERLGAEITELCSYIYAAQYRFLTLVREFDEREYWAELGLCSCAHWLNFKCGIGMNAAREKVRVAHALADLPRISAAFERGALSYSKVRAMTRVADPDNEDYLLMIATHGTAHHVERLVSQYRTASRLQDNDTAGRDNESRELTHYYDQDGYLVIRARMPAEQGALVVRALEMAAEQPAGDTRKDDVTAETSAREEPLAARRADALAHVAETYLSNSESSGSTADRYQVVLHVTAETSHLEDGPHVTAETSHLEDGPHVTAETSRRIACDSSVVCIKEDKNGEPLSIGRRSRSIPPPMRRALLSRDKGCRFPGCTNTRFVDGHHIEHWAEGGETSLDNLVLLCRHHHLVHEGGFCCEKDDKGDVVFRDQRFRKLDAVAPLPEMPGGDALLNWLDREFFEFDIDSETCAAQWHAGERIDWTMAVSAMFPR